MSEATTITVKNAKTGELREVGAVVEEVGYFFCIRLNEAIACSPGDEVTWMDCERYNLDSI